MNDKSLGFTIMIGTALLMIGYFIWAFADFLGIAWLAAYAEWAYKLPIIAGVYLILFIVLWIGYTMATTPPPIPLDNPLDLEKDDVKEK